MAAITGTVMPMAPRTRTEPEKAGHGTRHLATRAALIALLAVAALVSGASAFAASLGRQMPEVAVQVWPFAGDAHARAATRIIAGMTAQDATVIPDNLPGRVRDLSLAALAAEPTNVMALRNLAFYYSSHGDTAKAGAMMAAAQAMSRRDIGVNLWLVDRRLREARLGDALDVYDTIMRTNSAASALLLQRMAATLDRPGVTAAFADLLERSPPWQFDFWTEVLSREGSMTNAALLRQELHRRKVPMEPSHDGILIARLANSGSYAAAFALYRSLGGTSDRTNLLVDGNFTGAISRPPIGWRTPQDGNLGADIDREKGALELTALPDAGGVFAQQLIELGRSARFAARADYAVQGPATPLEMEIACADGNTERKAKVALPAGRTVPIVFAGGCRYAWVSLSLPPDPDPAGRSVIVSSVSLSPEGR